METYDSSEYLPKSSELTPFRKEGCAAVEQDCKALALQTAICPQCTITVIKQRRATDSFFCSRCHKSYSSLEVIDAPQEEGLR
jgi:hypothetical protein